MIPKGFKHEHFVNAANAIMKNGVPESRKSYRYDLLLNGKKYPPKYIISIAYIFLHGAEFSPHEFNAVEAKDYFIRHGYTILDRKTSVKKPIIVNEDEESRFPEGKEKYKLHRLLERDSNISKRTKKLRLDQVGELRCDVCKFSFSDTYGEHGAGFIEAHHTIPIAKLNGERKTKVEEIALVCSNCHRMLHLGNQLLSIEDIKAIIFEQNQTDT